MDSVKQVDVAVLLTCHNRRETTIRCLDSLIAQNSPASKGIVLVDDGSSDGTSEEVTRRFPQVILVRGSGNLFWGGGMRLAAEAAASRLEAKFHLWLNDDVVLRPEALMMLLEAYENRTSINEGRSIVVGALQDPRTGKTSYSGLVRANPFHRLRFKLMEPDASIQRCDTLNGNIVLMPHSAAKQVGPIDPLFPHNMGDTDFGMRAVRRGWEVIIAPGYVGWCERNPLKSTFAEPTSSFSSRLRHINSPKGLPIGAWVVYARRHGGLLWPAYVALPYLGIILSVLPIVRRRYLKRKGFSET